MHVLIKHCILNECTTQQLLKVRTLYNLWPHSTYTYSLHSLIVKHLQSRRHTQLTDYVFIDAGASQRQLLLRCSFITGEIMPCMECLILALSLSIKQTNKRVPSYCREIWSMLLVNTFETRQPHTQQNTCVAFTYRKHAGDLWELGDHERWRLPKRL